MRTLLRLFVDDQSLLSAKSAVLTDIMRELEGGLEGTERYCRMAPRTAGLLNCEVSLEANVNKHLQEVEEFLASHAGIIRRATESGLTVQLNSAVYSSEIAGDGHYMRLTVWFKASLLDKLAKLGMALAISFYDSGSGAE